MGRNDNWGKKWLLCYSYKNIGLFIYTKSINIDL